MAHALRDETFARLIDTTTPAWRKVDPRETDEPTEEAVSRMCALGFGEVRIIAAIKMGALQVPKCRYVGGGEWWTLLEKELERLIPATWIGTDGKPKEYLLSSAHVTAIRLSSDGVDYNKAVRDGTWKKWFDGRPKKIKAYLRCDGVDRRAASGVALSSTPEAKTILETLAGENGMTVTQEALADATHLSLPTVRKYLTFLRDHNLIHRPHGPRKGDAITDAGRALLARR